MISGCLSGTWGRPTHPVEYCIEEAKTFCEELPQLGETQPIGKYTVDVMLMYKLCALKHEILVRCATTGTKKIKP